MDLVSGIVVYILLWWWVFLMALPFGAKPVEKPEAGHAPSAPAKPMLWRKAAVTTIIAGMAWLGMDWLINSGIYSFRSSVY